jgi:hypothetical protein
VYDLDFAADTTGPRGNRLWSAKRLGKRLAALWQYVTEVADARQERDAHGHAATFTVKPKRFVRFDSLKQEKSPARADIETLPDSAPETADTATSSPQPRLTIDETDVAAHRTFAAGGNGEREP